MAIKRVWIEEGPILIQKLIMLGCLILTPLINLLKSDITTL